LHPVLRQAGFGVAPAAPDFAAEAAGTFSLNRLVLNSLVELPLQT
jgi:hypothetical protein